MRAVSRGSVTDATKLWGFSLTLFDANQIDWSRGRVLCRSPADETTTAAEAISNQIRMPKIIVDITKGDADHPAIRHFCDGTVVAQIPPEFSVSNDQLYRWLAKRRRAEQGND